MRGYCQPKMRSRSNKSGRQNRKRESVLPCRSCRTLPISTISIRSRPNRQSIWSACGQERRSLATSIS
jgi:hypothetical protein